MCLLALLFRVVDDAPVVVGANREEAYARGGEPPRLLEGTHRIVAGSDPVAGGTWLGVNEHGVLVAVTNRPKTEPPPQPRSRGLLTRDLLEEPTAAAAVERAIAAFNGSAYAGCNLLCVDAHSATVIHAGDWLRVRPLPPGIHVLTAQDVNDIHDPRIAFALGWLHEREPRNADQAVSALRQLCALPGPDTPPMCLRGPTGGTVSSSIIVLRKQLERGVYHHASGPPDTTPYEDYSHLLRGLAHKS
ncbi:MAG: NRDE family protein [Gemmataceae bacterium]